MNKTWMLAIVWLLAGVSAWADAFHNGWSAGDELVWVDTSNGRLECMQGPAAQLLPDPDTRWHM